MIIDFLVCTWSVKEAPTFLSRHLGGQMPEAEILICTVFDYTFTLFSE